MPPKRGYDWADGPPLLDEHSKAKHRLLRSYLDRYIRTLLQNRFIPELRLSLVDGFAGGGLYSGDDKSLLPGSPLIMLAAVRQAREDLVASGSRQTLNVAYFFVEKNSHAKAMLAQAIADRGFYGEPGNVIEVLEGEFATHATKIMNAIASRKGGERAIFFLDQYGYTDVPLDELRKIFAALKGAEIILTIALDWLTDFIRDAPKFYAAMQNSGLELDAGKLIELRKVAPDEALVEGVLHWHIVKQSGASFFTPFFLTPESNRKLWLLHLSRHPRARQEMMGVHWEISNLFRHIGGAGLDQFAAVNAIILPESLEEGTLGPMFNNKVRILGYGRKGDLDGQLLLEQDFGDRARTQTRDALCRQLPELLSGQGKITMDTLITNIANHMPADTPLIGEALQALSEAKQVVLTGPGGGRKRDGALQGDDVIELPSQPMLFDFMALRKLRHS